MTATLTPTGPMGPTGEIPYTDLAEELRGALLVPGTPEHTEAATPWNLAVPAHPFPIVRAADAADVAATIRFARQHAVQVDVRATGHGPLPASGPTLLVHTGGLDRVEIDVEARTATVGAGVRWAQVLEAGAPYGLLGMCGSAPHVGVVGYLTGGGLSPLSRSHGMASDHVRSFEVVTGENVVVQASPTENPDLFWALRGGKGAAGVVTSAVIDLLPVPTFHGGAVFFAAEDIATVLHAWRGWATSLPEQASTSVAIMRMPDAPHIPPPLAGKTTLSLRFAWLGDPAEGDAIIAPMLALADPVLGGITTMPSAAIGALHMDPVDPMPVVEHAAVLAALPEEAVDALLSTAGPDSDCTQIMVEVRLMGGALSRPAPVADAVDQRGAAFSVFMVGIGVPPVVDATNATGAAVLAALQPWSAGALPNFGGEVTRSRSHEVYRPATLERLACVVDQHDPSGVLRAADGVRP